MSGDLLREQLKTLPNRPGVYLFRSAEGEVLYVGKASSLRSRVRSYFGSGAERSFKGRELSKRATSVETFLTGTPAEALLLESNLIKEHSPRFNIQLRDDKTFPYVKVTVNEPFPRILVTRRLQPDGSRHFGPFTDVGAMRRALRMIRQMFTVRSCHYDLPVTAPDRPCLDYFIDRCRAPCVGKQSEAEYGAMIDRILDILSGHTARLKRDVRQEMEEASDSMEYERAAELRDVLRGIEAFDRRQLSIDSRGGDRDVLGIAADDTEACCVFLRVREGKLLGRNVHFLRFVEGSDLAAIVSAAVTGPYLRGDDLPPELIVPADFSDRALVESVLANNREGPFGIRVPQRWMKRRLLELAERNAAHILAERSELEGSGREEATPPPAARALAVTFGLESPPQDVACFDISTLSGRDSVGSAVWLRDGIPRTKEYRRFRIRETEDGRTDDYSMMQEVVGRYFARRVQEGGPIPDLVVIDGGKGQLGAALHAMESSGVSDIPVVALAKRNEEVFVPGTPDPICLDRRNEGLRWLQRARDEAHRFAIGYNRKLRARRTLRSRISEIRGVGPAREKDLLREFGSLEAIRRASAEELVRVPGIGPVTARRIIAALSARGGGERERHDEPPRGAS